MGQVSIYLHKRILDYMDFLASLMEASRSEVIEDCLKHIRDENLEEDVWGGDFTEAIDELEEEEIESESDYEEEEEEESESED